MTRKDFPQDRFDVPVEHHGRVGAHRAENPRLRGWPLVIWASIATVVLIAAGIFGTLVVTGRVSPFPGATSTAGSATDSIVSPVLDTSYTVLVLNATTETGLATRLADQLIAVGFAPENVLPGDAGSTGFEKTTVYYPFPGDRAAALGLADAIGGAEVAEDARYQPESDPDATQLVVVIGQDRTTVGVVDTPED